MLLIIVYFPALRLQRTAALAGRTAEKVTKVERHLWVAPALQEFFGDVCGYFVSTFVCPACLRGGIVATGLDEFRERGSNRLIDL